MHYLIDGHNLIGCLPDIRLDDPNDEALLVQKLASFVARTRQRCTVVFDHGLPGGRSKMSTRGVQVVFASHQSTADQVLRNRIANAANPKEWTLVSSDHDVINTARRRKMHTLRSFEFAALIERPPAPVRPGVDEAVDVRLSDAEIDEWLEIFEAPTQPGTLTPPIAGTGASAGQTRKSDQASRKGGKSKSGKRRPARS